MMVQVFEQLYSLKDALYLAFGAKILNVYNYNKRYLIVLRIA
jgi:hypothetical protein